MEVHGQRNASKRRRHRDDLSVAQILQAKTMACSSLLSSRAVVYSRFAEELLGRSISFRPAPR